MNCPRCTSRMTMLFTSAVCDICDPPGGKATPVVDLSTFMLSMGYSKFTVISDRPTNAWANMDREFVLVLDQTSRGYIRVTYNKAKGLINDNPNVNDCALECVRNDVWDELWRRASKGPFVNADGKYLPITTRAFACQGTP